MDNLDLVLEQMETSMDYQLAMDILHKSNWGLLQKHKDIFTQHIFDTYLDSEPISIKVSMLIQNVEILQTTENFIKICELYTSSLTVIHNIILNTKAFWNKECFDAYYEICTNSSLNILYVISAIPEFQNEYYYEKVLSIIMVDSMTIRNIKRICPKVGEWYENRTR